MGVCLVIPVRLASERFPNKPLALFKGKTLIQNSIDIAQKLDFVDKIVLACSEDNLLIKGICKENEIDFLYIRESVSCGTEKVYYAKNKYPDYNYYMTLPIDEPSIDPNELNEKLDLDLNYSIIRTLYCDFYNEDDLEDNKSCKILTDKNDNIFYTSRAVVPSGKNNRIDLKVYKKHIGVFVFPKNAIKLNLWNPSNYSDIESLEQNMLIPFGLKAIKINHVGFGIDSIEQVALLEKRISTN